MAVVPTMGTKELRTAMAGFYSRWFGVTLDPDREIQPLIGSKEGILHATLALANVGDKVLVPNPGYPTYTSLSKLLGCEVVPYGLRPENGWQPDFEELERLTEDKEFSVLMGRDTLIHAALCYGATGAIASCANVAPRIAADIYDKYVEGDLEGSLEAQFTLAPLRIACGMGTFPAVIKEGLVQQGIPVGKCLAPISELKPEEKEKLHQVLVDMKLI